MARIATCIFASKRQNIESLLKHVKPLCLLDSNAEAVLTILLSNYIYLWTKEILLSNHKDAQTVADITISRNKITNCKVTRSDKSVNRYEVMMLMIIGYYGNVTSNVMTRM